MNKINRCAIEIENVTKVYGSGQISVKALNNANLSIYDNEFFTLLGPSGCGKTTLLRLIAGFEDITQGNIRLFNDDIALLPPNKRPVNTVFQHYALFPHLNVYDNISFGLERLRHDKSFIKERTEKVLNLVQMEDFLYRKPNQLSGGQQQRVALARALAPEPKVLLLDEPLSALDLKLRQAMRVELKRLQRETGITFVFVTHDQEEALTMSDRIAVMSEGEIQQIGTPEEIYENPSNQYVANFIGDVNLLDGICTKIGKNGLCKLLSGHTVTLEIPNNIKIGDKITIFIRPERLKINKTKSSKVETFINEFTYLGNSAFIEIISNKQIINASLPIDKVKDFHKGDKIDIDFPSNNAQVIKK